VLTTNCVSNNQRTYCVRGQLVWVIFLGDLSYHVSFHFPFFHLAACNLFVILLRVCATSAAIGSRPGHETFGSSCAKKAGLLRNSSGTRPRSESWEKTGRTQTRRHSGSTREPRPHASPSHYILALIYLTPTKQNPWGPPPEDPPSLRHHTGWRRHAASVLSIIAESHVYVFM